MKLFSFYSLLLLVILGCVKPQKSATALPISKPNQIQLLADSILHHARLDTTNYKWVYFHSKLPDKYVPLNDTILNRLRQQYIVYIDYDQIPQFFRIKDEGSVFTIGYKSGINYNIEILLADPDTIVINHRYWYGNLGSEDLYLKYKWDGKQLIFISEIQGCIS